MNQSLGSRVQTGSEAGETQDAARDYRDFVEKAHRMTDSDIARRLWEEREETFPPRLRRKPDAMDEIAGTWKIFRDVDPASRPLLGGRA